MKISNPLAARRQLLKEVLTESYFEFFKYFWDEVSSEVFIANWHIEQICNELQKVGERVVKRLPKEYDLIINLPPGMSKTTMVTELFPVWVWVNDPTLQICTSSFDIPLAMRQSSKSRRVISSDKFQALFRDVFSMSKSEDAKGFYRNEKGGFRLSASIGSNVTGSHFHLIIKDDIVNPKGVLSAAILAATIEFAKALSTRKVNKDLTPEIMVMQRLHEDDPTGYLLNKRDELGLKIRHICLPATDDYPIYPPEYRENYIDGLLDPVRLSRETLRRELVSLGSRDYAGQFGQSPRPMEGNLFKRQHFQIVSMERLPNAVRSELARNVVADTAFKDKQQNDPSGFLSYVAHKGYLFVMGWRKGRWEFPQLIEQLKQFVADEGSPDSLIDIEPKASGSSVVQTLKQTTELLVREWEMSTGDKVERANSIIPYCEASKVFLVKAPWNDAFIDACLVFPNGRHDEEVDCLVMAAVNAFVRKRASGYSFFRAGE